MSLNISLTDDDDRTPIQLQTEPPTVGEPDSAFADVDIEVEARQEIETNLEAFKRKASREEARMLDAVDSEFWVCLCFQNRAQKEEFLRKLDILDLGDKYIDGMDVANRLAIDLDTPFEGMPIRNIDGKLTGQSPEFDEPYPST